MSVRIFREYCSQLSTAQKRWYVVGVVMAVAIIAAGAVLTSTDVKSGHSAYSTDQSIGQVASGLEVTGKALARDLGLPLEVSKKKPLRSLGISQEKLNSVATHLESHVPSNMTYFVYVALVAFGLLYMVRLGRPEASPLSDRRFWYSRVPYIAALLLAVVLAGFVSGKSPNPMEGVVKVFKAMVGLYPSVWDKLLGLVFFVVLAIVGNKLVCGWACPFGAIQELIHSIPILRKLKSKKLPFAVTNTVRTALFLVALALLFGIVGERRGYVVYHVMNPFNLFDLDFEATAILVTVVVSLVLAAFVYRPFCHIICPFGLVAWAAERLSLARVRIDPAKCTKCGACIRACPSRAAMGRVNRNILPPDCFSCARCLNVCPYDAIHYGLSETRR